MSQHSLNAIMARMCSHTKAVEVLESDVLKYITHPEEGVSPDMVDKLLLNCQEERDFLYYLT